MKHHQNTFLIFLSIIVISLFFSSSLYADNMVYAPLYEDHIPYCNEIANTAEAYADAENAELISSLDMVDGSASTLFIVAHGTPSGILSADGSTISWAKVISTAVENGVETLVIDSCSSGSAIITAQHMKLTVPIEIFTSSDVDEPSRAEVGGTSVYSQMWIEDCIASYNAGGMNITPQYAVFH